MPHSGSRSLILALHRASLGVSLALVVGACSKAPAPVVDPPARPAGNGWMTEVSARIRDASHAFVPDGDSFVAEVVDEAITGRFDRDAVHLSLQGDTIRLRSSLTDGRFASVPPVLGACLDDMVEPGGDCVRRLEYRRDGITEWWASREQGFEQGWTIDSPPTDGELTIGVDVDGAGVVVAQGEVWLQGDHGGLLMVEGLWASDADGRALETRFEPTDSGFRVWVDDGANGGRRVRYPITVDPIYTTASWQIRGNPEDNGFGWSVAGAGDVDGDGYDDVIVGASGYLVQRGRAYIFPGSSGGVASTASTTLTGEAYSRFGWSVSGAGDVNGDGYGDVIVGSYTYNLQAGLAGVYLGSSTGLSTTASTTLDGDAASHFGWAVSGAGDVNGDGYDDVIVGSNGYNSSAGRAELYLGSSGGVASAASTTAMGDNALDELGASVSAAGDVNGDGYDDVAVGVRGYDGSAGRVIVYLGSSAGLSGSPSSVMDGESGDDFFGSSVSGAGDVNGDGYDDLVVGAPGYGSYSGRAYLFLGAAGGTEASASTTLSGSGYLGRAVAGAGDVNGDGFDDVVVGSPWDDDGYAYVYEGSPTGLSSSPSTSLTNSVGAGVGCAVAGAGDVNGDGYDDVVVGAASYGADVYLGGSGGASTSGEALGYTAAATALGCSVSEAGDVNGDGYDDVIVGASGYVSQTGQAYVYLGSSTGLSGTAATTITGEATSNRLGSSVSGAGDVNGDGYDDVLVGAYGYSSGAGRAYVFQGSSSGVTSTASTTLTGSSASSLGYSVSGAGDVNGDGYDDVVVGAFGETSYAGRAYVHLGSSSGVSGAASATLTGESRSDYFGRGVSDAGDVNGDGYDDVIVGAYGYGSDNGRAYVFSGSSSGVSSTASATITGDASSQFGESLSGAGDVNGDGYDDIVVGAEGYSSYTGRAYVYSGSSTGLSTTVSATFTGDTASQLGYAVSGAGDVNADGYDDVLITQTRYDIDVGRVYLYLGGSAGLPGAPDITLTGEEHSQFGSAVSGAGDVNGDGYSDVIVGTAYAGAGGGTALVFHGYPADADADGADENLDCDDSDASLGAASVWYTDADGDGHGTEPSQTQCDQPPGYVADSSDCDDSDTTVNPAATEVCDGVDNNCDGLTDDASATGQPVWYSDADGDGFGSAPSLAACDQPAGYVTDATDCDDANAALNPVATETCDGVDNNCDGWTDDSSATEQATWYADTDGDDYGSAISVTACDQPSGYVAVDTDCDDTDATYHPGAVEDDCTDPNDYNCDGSVGYTDVDGDGVPACLDCEDTNPAVTPSAIEVCDGIDNNCDGLTDDPSAAGQATWYADADGDGFGSTLSATACDQPAGYVADSTDCDDNDGAVNPAGIETCDGIDDNCDGLTDDASATDPSTWYADTDGDGYGSSAATPAVLACDQPAGYVLESTDCDDTNTGYHPGADEQDCSDPNDYNCDGSVGYADADGDGFAACQECDDSSGAVNPNATEVCNGLDDDCDGTVDQDAADATVWYADTDADGYTDPDVTVTDCDPPEGFAAPTTADCDDADAAVHPDAEDVPDDGVDQDCDGVDAGVGTDEETGVDGGAADTGPVHLIGECGCASGEGGGATFAVGVAIGLAFRRRRGRSARKAL